MCALLRAGLATTHQPVIARRVVEVELDEARPAAARRGRRARVSRRTIS